MAGNLDVDLRELITTRRAEWDLQVEKLSQQLQEARVELEELAVAERVAARLAEQLRAEAGPEAASSSSPPGRAS